MSPATGLYLMTSVSVSVDGDSDEMSSAGDEMLVFVQSSGGGGGHL